jgi:hypothetical protein
MIGNHSTFSLGSVGPSHGIRSYFFLHCTQERKKLKKILDESLSLSPLSPSPSRLYPSLPIPLSCTDLNTKALDTIDRNDKDIYKDKCKYKDKTTQRVRDQIETLNKTKKAKQIKEKVKDKDETERQIHKDNLQRSKVLQTPNSALTVFF